MARAGEDERGTAGGRPGANKRPDLAVVVLSYRNEETLSDAIDSLLAQEEPLEIVVSHSGGGPTPEILARRYPQVRVTATPERRLPGAARNAGIAITGAPFVAFLAADCRAEPGWASARIARHRAGANAVSSALLPVAHTPASVASYLLTHSWRMPHLRHVGAPFARLHHRPTPGVSYSRKLLDRPAPFSEDLLAGEDTLLNDRLQDDGVEVVWAPEVITTHSYPTGVVDMLSDQYRRGRLRGSLHGGHIGWRIAYAARSGLEPLLAGVRAAHPASPLGRRRAGRVAALLAVAALVRVVGILRAGYPAGSGAGEFREQRHRRLLGRRADRRDRRVARGAGRDPRDPENPG
jgi:hypothetical protein